MIHSYFFSKARMYNIFIGVPTNFLKSNSIEALIPGLMIPAMKCQMPQDEVAMSSPFVTAP